MTFGYPYRLLLLVPVVLAVLTALRRQPPALRLSGAAADAGPAAGTSRRTQVFRSLPLLLEGIALALLVAALASPRVGGGLRSDRVESLDIVFALDISGSMNAYDPPEGMPADALRDAVAAGTLVSRFEGMRNVLARFAATRETDRVGLIVFARRSYLACPLTEDREFLSRALADAAPGLVADGTGLAAPILHAIRSVRDEPGKHPVLVLFTDGENNVADPSSPEDAAAAAAALGLTVYTVGVGSDRAYLEVPGIVSRRYAPVSTRPDEALLRMIAATTGGFYFRAANEEGFREAVERIDAIERDRVRRARPVPVRTFDGILAAVALALFLTSAALRNTRFLHIP